MPASIGVQITCFTHQGRVRDGNEDCIGVGDWVCNMPMSSPRQWRGGIESPLMCVVADGMGGHAAGEIASQYAVNRMKEESLRIRNAGQLAGVLKSIDIEMHDLMMLDRSRVGMGTTIVGLLLLHERLIWFNVGDSRLYRHGGGSLKQISVDDVPDLKRRSHLITQSLGGTAAIQPLSPHTGEDDLPIPSRWLLCSDGLTDMAATDAMEKCMAASDLEATSKLFELAMRAGGHDNISIIVASIVPAGALASAWEQGATA